MIITDDKLKELLTKMELLNDKKTKEVEEFMKNNNSDFTTGLVELNIMTDEDIGMTIANELKIPFVNLSKISISDDVFHIVPERTARAQKVIAFERTPEGIKVAMADPNNKEIISLLEHKTQQKILPHLATERDIASAFYIFKKDLQKAFDALIEKSTHGSTTNLKDVPVGRIVDLIIETAYYDKVSDIHIEPQDESCLVRYRMDGMLHDVLSYNKVLHDRIMTRLKVLSRLRTDEHMSPQDGKLRFEVTADEYLDLRLSIIPIVEGEKSVLRLLSSHNKQITLTDLGMTKADLEKVSKAYTKSYGMILSTGPTGSGKSTSIYSILKVLNTRAKNITTIEDPVEYRIKGVNQIQVNAKTNLTFASGLRSILRQDPNIILVGEIRDSETAGIAVNAALTGHLVVSTLHTNDSATALPRLVDMKIEPFLVASTVNVIIAQRLIRKICEMCKTSLDITYDEMIKNISEADTKKYFGDKKTIRIYKGAGCKICHGTGYTGRVALFEVLEVTPEVRKLILQKSDSDLIIKQAQKEGMTTMLQDGVEKVSQGITTLEEVLRVTKVEAM